MRAYLLPLALALGSCAPATPIAGAFETATRTAFAPDDRATLPAMKTFGAPKPAPVQTSNADLARDFLDLAFRLESGRALPVLTRFEGPIRLRVTGKPPGAFGPDLTRLLYRLQREAGIDITLTRDPEASITIEAVSRADIRKALPQAACFVVPNVRSIKDYRSAKRAPQTNWTTLRTRQKIAIFIPYDVSPQEMRDCLHEELAQALGPLNDLYRLPDSVFNDDNVHTVLTGHDMLILRAYYDPALRSGMSREQVAARLPDILARIHPDGENQPSRFARATPIEFSLAIQTALGPGATRSERAASAQRALGIAQAQGWQDNRRAFAHFAAGRLMQRDDPAQAKAHFEMANQFYSRTPNAGLHQAYVAAQLAAYALAEGDGASALRRINASLPATVGSENAALLATLLMMKAEALELTGQMTEARAIRLDSLGWARYGFGPDWAVRAKEREIAALNPLKGRS
ncbi:MAG: DUF2927 domain-containing protein [Pseudomonadota bacterium]